MEKEKIEKYVKEIVKVVGIYLIWITVHYFASHFYVLWCTTNTVLGFILSPFLVTTPYCHVLRWCIYNSANQIIIMWTVLGTWLITKIM
jgi:hypothetical protein